jgi:TonB-linked SusC/RagA family outer membrane protein
MKIYTGNTCRPPGYMPKFLLVMKLTLILLVTAIVQVSANTYAQQITINEKNAPLEKILKQVRVQSGYDFLFDAQLVNKAKPVNVQFKNANIDEALQSILKGQALTYSIAEHTVIIRAEEKSILSRIIEKVAAINLTATPFLVIGHVTNLNGEALSGANVIVKRTREGTNTDFDGSYIMRKAEANDSLVFSFIGYESVTLGINSRVVIHVQLKQATNGMDEVVVQGYGRTTKRSTTGNIARVGQAEIEKQPIMNPLLALQGRVAGLSITQQDGYEGGPLKVEIRGRSAINPNFTSDPLYIIDGVPLTVLDVSGTYALGRNSSAISRGTDQSQMSFSGGQSPLFNINPSDIESIEVLKDADATAIYGSRGANGVILISTKRGKAGTNQLLLSGGQGVTFVTRYFDMLKTAQYLEMRREAFKNDAITATSVNAPDLLSWDPNAYTDWQKRAFGGHGSFTNIQTSLSGGNAQTTYRVSAGLTNTSDITTLSGVNRRGSVSFNVTNHSTNNRFTTSLSANYGLSKMNQISVSGTSTLAPNAPPPLNADGNLNYDGWASARGIFPFSNQLVTFGSDAKLLTSNLTMSYNVIKGLSAILSLGYNNTINNSNLYLPLASQDPKSPVKPVGSSSFGTTTANNWIIEPQLTYNKLIGKGNFNALIGGSVQNNSTDGLRINGSGYTSDVLLHYIANAPIQKVVNFNGKYKYAGVFMRLGYNWESKYILNLNGRHDGSSRFGPGNQFGNFGSVGVAWIASDESFIKQIMPSAISLIKFRGSYGVTGSDAVGDYQYVSQWGVNSTAPISSYNGVSPLNPLIQPNPNFHWQVNKKLEAAVDIGLFNDRIQLEAAFYRNRSDNQLINFPTPDFSGFPSVTANSPANVQNSGWEFLLNAQVINNTSFKWSANFNIGINRNKLLGYPNLEASPYRTQYKVGTALDNVYLLNYTGVDPATGQYTYVDLNNDGTISSTDSFFPGTGTDDRYIIVSTTPKYFGGFTNILSYRGLSLTTVFSFAKQIGRNAISSNAGKIGNISPYQFNNTWRAPGQQALFARFTNVPVNSDIQLTGSTALYTDASFVKFRTIALSYNLSPKIAGKLGVSSLAININAQNLFTITPYKGIDPEVQNFGGLPPTRTITGGLTCTFNH